MNLKKQLLTTLAYYWEGPTRFVTRRRRFLERQIEYYERQIEIFAEKSMYNLNCFDSPTYSQQDRLNIANLQDRIEWSFRTMHSLKQVGKLSETLEHDIFEIIGKLECTIKERNENWNGFVDRLPK